MGRGVGFAVMLLAAAAGLYLYLKQAQSVSQGGAAPTTTVDMIGVRNDLMAMANAERRFWATNARYASLDELRSGGDTYIPERPRYRYSAEASETRFRISAIYSGPDPKAPKQMSVDETMTLKTD